MKAEKRAKAAALCRLVASGSVTGPEPKSKAICGSARKSSARVSHQMLWVRQAKPPVTNTVNGTRCSVKIGWA